MLINDSLVPIISSQVHEPIEEDFPMGHKMQSPMAPSSGMYSPGEHLLHPDDDVLKYEPQGQYGIVGDAVGAIVGAKVGFGVLDGAEDGIDVGNEEGVDEGFIVRAFEQFWSEQ